MSTEFALTSTPALPAGHRIFSVDGKEVMAVFWTPLKPPPSLGAPWRSLVTIVSLVNHLGAAVTVASGQTAHVDISRLEPDEGRRTATVALRRDPIQGFVLSGILPLDLSAFYSGDIGVVDAPIDPAVAAGEPAGVETPPRFGPGEPWSRRKAAAGEADPTPTE